MKIFRRFKKSISLRIVNWLGLSIMFACLLVSYSYIKRELSYDRYNVNADRMVRIALQKGSDPFDGAIWGNDLDVVMQQIPEIEQVVKLAQGGTAVLSYKGEKQVVNFYRASPNFFDVFSISWMQGEKSKDWQFSNQMIVSESFARRVFGTDGDIGEVKLSGIYTPGSQFEDSTILVSGIFKDIPETSHFHTDMFLYRTPETQGDLYFMYLLLKKHVNIKDVENKISQLIEERDKSSNQPKTNVSLMPITNIHFHSHMFRELEANGNVNYIYFIFGANMLLLIVVLFNLWLNNSLIFSYNSRYYQILRINGASSFTVVKEESLLAVMLGCFSLLTGILLVFSVSYFEHFPIQITPMEIILVGLIFLSITTLISLFPALKNISITLFLNTSTALIPARFSYSNVRLMLVSQYIIVMVVVILAFGITKQMNMVKDMQVGGNMHNILVMTGQPDQVSEKYSILKTELLKHTEIEAVTSSYHLPGSNMWQSARVNCENRDENIDLSAMIVGEDFLPFFHISLIDGKLFSPAKFDYLTEESIMLEGIFRRKKSDHVEEYIINKKAMTILGFNSSKDAIGQVLSINLPGLDYIYRGTIIGVTNDFNYSGLYEQSSSMLIIQRRMFQSCIMAYLHPGRMQQSLEVFHRVWNEVIPEYPASYTFMNDIFNNTYRYELYAKRLVLAFSFLCIAITNLGLIVFMAFIIQRRKKEIGIRKVNGANISNIVWLLNLDFVRWIGLSFIIAAPVAWYTISRWLEKFAYRTSLDWWVFAVAGLAVLLLSFISVSLQSWRAANTNPVEVIKNE